MRFLKVRTCPSFNIKCKAKKVEYNIKTLRAHGRNLQDLYLYFLTVHTYSNSTNMSYAVVLTLSERAYLMVGEHPWSLVRIPPPYTLFSSRNRISLHDPSNYDPTTLRSPFGILRLNKFRWSQDHPFGLPVVGHPLSPLS